ncbi:hypothetical protein [Demequina mangrovi]|uniref:Uncharacterized protein n=1 Tax=Demequina mangrovi TaxID=1043493 RepID=A0A1H6UQA9_9MICO|nr:hypothetical protein [Demequina mangrovi]SEI91947.1 hypothetical protein SAMN05421637_0414 [Demequina mangrovi]
MNAQDSTVTAQERSDGAYEIALLAARIRQVSSETAVQGLATKIARIAQAIERDPEDR